MSDWEINWRAVAQEAEKVRDLALEAQAEATLARVKAEQERDVLRDQLAAEARAKESLGHILVAARSEAIMLQREHAAILAGANAARVKTEHERDAARREADLLRRQVGVMAEHIAIGGECPSDIADCPAPDDRETEESDCATCWSAWAAQQVKEGCQ